VELKSNRRALELSNGRLGLVSYGVALIILAVCLILPAAEVIAWSESPALILMLLGVWTMILAAVKLKRPQKYARSPFSTFGWGVLITAVGSLWILNIRGLELVYSVAVIAALLGAIAIAAAFRKH